MIESKLEIITVEMYSSRVDNKNFNRLWIANRGSRMVSENHFNKMLWKRAIFALHYLRK